MVTAIDSRRECKHCSTPTKDARTAITNYEGATAVDQPIKSTSDGPNFGSTGAKKKKVEKPANFCQL